jgi:hypothetical protein
MNHYVIRLNIQPCEQQFMWRVFENGVEQEFASEVRIEVPSYSETTQESYPDRFGRFERNNMACDGYAHWQDGRVTITATP